SASSGLCACVRRRKYSDRRDQNFSSMPGRIRPPFLSQGVSSFSQNVSTNFQYDVNTVLSMTWRSGNASPGSRTSGVPVRNQMGVWRFLLSTFCVLYSRLVHSELRPRSRCASSKTYAAHFRSVSCLYRGSLGLSVPVPSNVDHVW